MFVMSHLTQPTFDIISTCAQSLICWHPLSFPNHFINLFKSSKKRPSQATNSISSFRFVVLHNGFHHSFFRILICPFCHSFQLANCLAFLASVSIRVLWNNMCFILTVLLPFSSFDLQCFFFTILSCHVPVCQLSVLSCHVPVCQSPEAFQLFRASKAPL